MLVTPVSDELMQLFVSHTFSTYSTYAIIIDRGCQVTFLTFLTSDRLPGSSSAASRPHI